VTCSDGFDKVVAFYQTKPLYKIVLSIHSCEGMW